MVTVFISAPDKSADVIGAHLAMALMREQPETKVWGIGGCEMRSAGVLWPKCLKEDDLSRYSVLGIFEFFSHVRANLAVKRSLRKLLEEVKPAIVVGVSAPGINNKLARLCFKRGIPFVYYPPPEIWAWQFAIKRRPATVICSGVRGLVCNMPHEAEFFKKQLHFSHTYFFGNPVFERVVGQMDQETAKAWLDIPKDRCCIGLLPGSRSGEVKRLLPKFLKAAAKISSDMNGKVTFLLAIARDNLIDESRLLRDAKAVGIDLRLTGIAFRAPMKACDCALACSGTVTLELAALGVPQVVAYSWILPTTIVGYMLKFFRLLKFPWKHFSLPNIILESLQTQNKAVDLTPYMVKELWPGRVRPRLLAEEAKALIDSKSERRRSVLDGYKKIRQHLDKGRVSNLVAHYLLDFARNPPQELMGEMIARERVLALVPPDKKIAPDYVVYPARGLADVLGAGSTTAVVDLLVRELATANRIRQEWIKQVVISVFKFEGESRISQELLRSLVFDRVRHVLRDLSHDEMRRALRTRWKERKPLPSPSEYRNFCATVLTDMILREAERTGIIQGIIQVVDGKVQPHMKLQERGGS